MTSTHELGIPGNIGNDRFRRACRMQISCVIRDSLDGSGIAHVDILGVLGGIERNAERVIEAGSELFNLRGFAVGAYAAKDEDGAGAGVSEKEIAVGSHPEQAGHRKCAPAQLHVLLVVSTLHGSGIASGVKRHLEACWSNRPGIRWTG